ncbi:MAG TPA: hypothetical protein VMS21_13960 [Methylomirabilota bacterium]|nr:hypothetical protein [Methylomirabilota bacterium]
MPLLFVILPAHAQLIYEENFNTDGDGTRYFTEGRAVFEVDTHAANGIIDQEGPVYWAHNFEVSFVGVPAASPERRAVWTWHHTLPETAVTPEALDLFDAVVNWLLRDQPNAQVLFSPAPAGTGDDILVQRLQANGHTVTFDAAGAVPPATSVDLVVHSSSSTIGASRFTTYPVPLLTYNGPDHDDELVSSIGQAGAVIDLGPVTITAPAHEAAGGLTGSFAFVNGEQAFDTVGDSLAEGSTVVAAYTLINTAPVESLATVDAMIAGTTPSTQTSGTVTAADLAAGANGVWAGNFPVPGNPTGGYAVVGTGQLDVITAGTYSAALGVDDGGRLRIDLDRNGLSADDDVIIMDGTGGFRENYADVTFPSTGLYAFEWVAFNSVGDFGSEISFTFMQGGGNTGPVNPNEWDPLGAPLEPPPVELEGTIALTVYVPDLPPVTEERPLVVVIEDGDEGGQVFGGGAFTGFEGTGFFAGAGLNKFPGGPARALQLNPVDVTGQSNLKLSIRLAGTDLDFETSDFLDILVDPDGTGPEPFQRLARFTAPSGNDKFITDGTTRLGIGFQDITYDLPAGATQLVIRFECLTTWWNEIVALDFVRITAGAVTVDPFISVERSGTDILINYTGTLQVADEVTGPFTDVATGVDQQFTLQPDPQVPHRFYRAAGN